MPKPNDPVQKRTTDLDGVSLANEIANELSGLYEKVDVAVTADCVTVTISISDTDVLRREGTNASINK